MRYLIMPTIFSKVALSLIRLQFVTGAILQILITAVPRDIEKAIIENLQTSTNDKEGSHLK